MLEEEGTDFSLLGTLPTASSYSTISVDAEVLVSVSSYGIPSYPTSHRAGTVQYREAGGPPAPWSAWPVPKSASPRPVTGVEHNDGRGW